MDNLFEQMANISKAHAFDVVSKQVGELKEINKDLLQALKAVQSDAKFDGFITPETTKQVTEAIEKASKYPYL